jgi:hypothetical protein
MAMAFNEFDLKTAVQRFELVEDRRTDVFKDVALLAPSDYLRDWLADFAPVALGINTEQARREYINEKEGTPIPVVHGCVTSGSNWRFLRLKEKNLVIDLPEYYIQDVAKILGILVTIACD